MIAFVGIDGTGPYWNTDYKPVFENSHVHTLYKSWPHQDLRWYHRGPAILGTDCIVEVGKAAAWLAPKLLSGVAKGVFLAGYSRGAAGVIELAYYMKKLGGYGVDCLILFDAVDRSLVLGGFQRDTPIVDTVKEAYHAVRDPQAHSRECFGNCGKTMQSRPATAFQSQYFFGSHGAIGGVPWPKGNKKDTDFVDEGGSDGLTAVTFAREQQCSIETGQWMRRHCDEALQRCRGRLGVATPGSWIPKMRQAYGRVAGR